MHSGLLFLIVTTGFAAGHMEISNPPPLRSKYNDFTTDVDENMVLPLKIDGSDFPCKGYHGLIGTDQGQSVVDYSPGQSYTMTITGQTPYDGGSCQISLSYDEGSTWQCRMETGANYPVAAVCHVSA